MEERRQYREPLSFLTECLRVLMSRKTPLNTGTYNSKPKESESDGSADRTNHFSVGRWEEGAFSRLSFSMVGLFQNPALVLSRSFPWKICDVKGQSRRRRRTVQISSGHECLESVTVTADWEGSLTNSIGKLR